MMKISMHSTICIWLTILYITCMTLVVFTLTTYQLQYKIFDTQEQSNNANSAFAFHECVLPAAFDITKAKASYQFDGLYKFFCIPLSKNKTFLTPSMINLQQKHVEEFENEISRKEKLLKNANVGETKKLTSDIQDLIFALSIFSQQYQHLEDLKAETNQHDEIFDFFGIEKTASMPKNILITILIFSMGTLGSLIFLTMEFLKQDDEKVEKFSTYFFRPLLGMVMALAVFVMYMSTKHIMGIEDKEQLSPFFISFISIISGMMSEKAYGSLVLQGNKMFSPENNKTPAAPRHTTTDG